jgi:hypothetical protein
MEGDFMETFDWYAWVNLPFIVFFARIADVTLGTLRIIFYFPWETQYHAPPGIRGSIHLDCGGEPDCKIRP